MELLIFTLNAIFIYLFSDWILRQVELRKGRPLKQRQMVFFLIFIALALASFELLNRTVGGT